MKLFREKASGDARAFPPVLITESSDIERLKSIARNTAAFDLGVGELHWDTQPMGEPGCMRLQLSGDYCFVIRP